MLGLHGGDEDHVRVASITILGALCCRCLSITLLLQDDNYSDYKNHTSTDYHYPTRKISPLYQPMYFSDKCVHDPYESITRVQSICTFA